MNKEELIRHLITSEDSDIEQILKNLLVIINSEQEEKKIIDVEEHISTLQSLSAAYKDSNSFKVGDIVQWKEGLKNKKLPHYDEPCIVVEVLGKPIIDKEAPLASPYYGEKLDIKLGILGPNGEFFTFYYDKNRFTLRK